jgi:hypothetical protein
MFNKRFLLITLMASLLLGLHPLDDLGMAGDGTTLSSSYYSIGTTVIIVITKDYIIIGADSKRVNLAIGNGFVKPSV